MNERTRDLQRLAEAGVFTRHPLDTLSVHDLAALRRIVGEVIAEGYPLRNGGEWKLPCRVFWSSQKDEREAFLDTIEQRIIECAAPNVKGANP